MGLRYIAFSAVAEFVNPDKNYGTFVAYNPEDEFETNMIEKLKEWGVKEF